MLNEQPSYYERRLQTEIEAIEARIKELNQEKMALQRQLVKARREGAGIADVNRKNSVTRIMIENKVIEALKGSAKPLNSRALYIAAQYVDFQLKSTTFRTYLHRMKNKGMIVYAGKVGVWKLPLAPENLFEDILG